MRKLDRQGPIRILLRVLGRFAVIVDADPPSELRISSRKGQALLAYLAMHRTTARAGNTWPHCSGATDATNKRATTCDNVW
jgi:hypothetical protein